MWKAICQGLWNGLLIGLVIVGAFLLLLIWLK